MTEQKNRIKTVTYGEVERLAKMFDCTPRTINNALREGTGVNADKIRKVALERGAVEIKSNKN